MAIHRFLQADPPFFAILRFFNRGIDAFSLAIAAAGAREFSANFEGSLWPIKIMEDRSCPLKFWRNKQGQMALVSDKPESMVEPPLLDH